MIHRKMPTTGGLAMSKKFLSVLIIISLVLSFTACGITISSKNGRVIPFGRDVPELYSETDHSSEEENGSTEDTSEEQNGSVADTSDPSSLLGEGDGVIGGLGGILGGLEGMDDISSLIGGGLISKKGWPSGSVPDELPEYTEGEIVNSGGAADDFTILVDNTNADALENYMNRLKEAGWIVTRDYDDQKEAVLGPYTLSFQWNASDFLQITIMTIEQGSWPYDELPPDLIPPETGMLVGEISIQQYDDSMYFVYTFDGLDWDASVGYMMMLIDNGWKGDDMFVSKNFEWNGKKYEASIEHYETIETRSSYSFNMWAIN